MVITWHALPSLLEECNCVLHDLLRIDEAVVEQRFQVPTNRPAGRDAVAPVAPVVDQFGFAIERDAASTVVVEVKVTSFVYAGIVLLNGFLHVDSLADEKAAQAIGAALAPTVTLDYPFTCFDHVVAVTAVTSLQCDAQVVAAFVAVSHVFVSSDLLFGWRRYVSPEGSC